MNTMEITHGRWRALARSSPWRWRSVHLTWHHALDDEDAVAWLRDRTDLRVGPAAVHQPAHEGLDLGQGERLATALAADDLGGGHGQRRWAADGAAVHGMLR